MLFADQARRLQLRVGDPVIVQTETSAGRTNTVDLTVVAVARDLAWKIVKDGEGATKFVTVAVTGADSDADARRLVNLIKGIPAKINLIPFNEWSGAPYKRSSNNRIRAFANIIYQAGYASPIRTPRGEDIMAACGQLKSETERARKSKAEIAREAGL